MDKDKFLEYLKEELMERMKKMKYSKPKIVSAFYRGQVGILKHLINEIQSGKFDKQPCETYSCAYCGETVNQQEDIDYHIRNCPKHPIAYYRHRIAELEQMQDKQPCVACKSWKENEGAFCCGTCGRELSK